MKTKDFIDFIATGAGPAPVFNVTKKLRNAMLTGLAASLGIGLLVHGIVVNPAALVSRWFKLTYALAVLTAGWILLKQLARPLSRVSKPLWGLVLAVLVMTGCGFSELISAPADQYDELLLGKTWIFCPLLILLISLPALAAALWTMRTLAPTRLRLAGFSAGIFAGAQGALGYFMICPEDSSLFVAVWYTLGMALSGLLGLLLGPRVLRW